MGSAMARNLISAGFLVTAFDTDPVRLGEVVAAGAQKASAPERISADVDVIILSLPNTHIVEVAITDSLRLLETARPGLIVIDTSTIDSDTSAFLATRLQLKEIEMLDAPVSGTPDMCAAKENIILAGGKLEVFDRCKTVFSAMAKEAVYIGANGSALTLKLVVNLVLALNRMALAEGLTLAAKVGFDQMQTLDVLKKSAAYSKAMDQKGERMVNRRFLPPIARLATTYKDLRFILALGAKLDCPLPLSALNAQALASEVCKGRGGYDSSDIISFYDDLTKVRAQFADS